MNFGYWGYGIARTAYESAPEIHLVYTQVCTGFARPFFANDIFVESVCTMHLCTYSTIFTVGMDCTIVPHTTAKCCCLTSYGRNGYNKSL